MNVQPVELVGSRARLVPLVSEHAHALLEAGRDPTIWTYLPRHPRTLADMKALVAEALERRDAGVDFPFVVLDQADNGQVVGSTRLCDIDRANRSLEIGWTWLDSAVWRTRINTECKRLLLGHCFETLGAIRVFLKTDARNVRSQKAIERIGATKEGVWRKHRILADGYVRDSVYYSVIDDEWPAVKVDLDELLARWDGESINSTWAGTTRP
jgi:RimJ/RimL family protein N-acetyltransferase